MEYIKREDAITELIEGFKSFVNEHIDECPAADVVEVVRCMDCKYSVRPVLATQMKCNRDGVYRWVFFDGYCDMGERK